MGGYMTGWTGGWTDGWMDEEGAKKRAGFGCLENLFC